MHKSIAVITDSVMASLCRYQWPGNIRELENFIERSEILSQGFELDAPVHELEMQQDDLAPAPEKLLDAERLHIARVLREANGVIGAAAVRLGLPRSTLFYKMRRLGICSSRPAQSQVLKQAAVA
jgi:formate hydrogenlyase transcriptional activator